MLTIVTVTGYGHWWSIIVAVTSTLSRRHQCSVSSLSPPSLNFFRSLVKGKSCRPDHASQRTQFPSPTKTLLKCNIFLTPGGTSAKSVWSNHGGMRQQCSKSTGIDGPDVEEAADACHHCSFLHIHWALHAFKANVITKQDPASALVLCALPKRSPASRQRRVRWHGESRNKSRTSSEH